MGEEGGTVQLFRLDATSHPLRVPVKLGRLSVSAVEIPGSLKPGDQVILSDMSAWGVVDRVRTKWRRRGGAAMTAMEESATMATVDTAAAGSPKRRLLSV